MIILAEFSPLDTVAGVRKTLRGASANDRKVTGLNGQTWKPSIVEESQLSIRLFKGDFDGEAAPSGGSVSFRVDKWLDIEPNVRRFVWQGAPVRLYAGVSGQAWPWPIVFEGIVDQFNAKSGLVKLNAKVNSEPFGANVLTASYLGTGGVEGEEGLKDKLKPWLFGRCFNVEPVLINSDFNVYQFSSYGQIQAINVLYERGSAFPAPLADYANYDLLVAAVIPSGQWATCLALGMMRLGAPAFGVITGDVDGDKFGGIWRRKTGEIIQRIAANSGVLAGAIESASFTSIDTALAALPNQGRIGVFIDSQITVLEIASALAAPCNAQVGVSLVGKMFVGRINIGAPSITLDAQQRQMPRVTSSDETGVVPPYSFIEMGYAKSWRVHTDDDIADIRSLFQTAIDLAATKGKVWTTLTLPTVAETSVGDTWISPTGEFLERVPSGGILLDGFAIVLDGFRPSLAWTYAASQPFVKAYADIATAQSTADSARERVLSYDDDAILSRTEKRALIVDSQQLENAYQAIVTSATSAGVSFAGLTALRAAYLSFLTTITPLWNDTNSDSPIVRTSLDTAVNNYAGGIADLRTLIEQTIKSLADQGVTNAATAQTTANAAQTQATQASVDAADAQQRVQNIVTDGLLDRSEKPAVVQQYSAILAEQSGIETQATAFAITTEKTAYTNAIAALTAYLTGLTPAYNNYSVDTAIVRATFNTNFNAVYAAKQALLNKIAAVAKQAADTAQASADNALTQSLAAAAAKGRLFFQALAPTAAESSLGDTWIDDYGVFYDRVPGSILLGGFIVVLNGFRPSIYWTKAAVQPLEGNIARVDLVELSAASANASIADISNDNVLTPSEKPDVIFRRDVILAAQSSNANTSALHGISSAAYSASIAALIAYLATLTSPTLWTNLTGITDIVGADMRAAFKAVYDQEVILNNLVKARTATVEAGADVTANTVPSHNPAIVAKTFTALFNGTLDAEQLPENLVIKRYRGTTDVSASSAWTIENQGGITGGTVTVVNGVVTIPTGAVIPLSGTVKVKSMRDGFALYSEITFRRVDAPAPNTGGGSGGTSVNDATLLSVTNTTSIKISDTLTVKTGVNGVITFSGNLTINAAAALPTGNFGAVMQWKYRLKSAGGTYINAGAAINQTKEAEVIDEPPIYKFNGSINAARTQTGLTANVDYEVELWAARDASAPVKTISFGGTIYAQGT